MTVEARVKRIFNQVLIERNKQIKRWGDRPAPPTFGFVAFTLLELCKLFWMFVHRALFGIFIKREDDYLIPMMAIMLLWLEKLEKQNQPAWQPPRVSQNWRGVGTPGGKQ